MRPYIQRAIRLFVLVILAFAYSNGQNQISDSSTLQQNVWTLQFGITGNSAATIAIKYQLPGTNALRGGVSISGNTNNANNTISQSSADTSIGALPSNNSSSSQNVSFNLQYLWYKKANSDIFFFIGLGPSFTYSYSHNSSNEIEVNWSNYSKSQYLYSSNSILWGTGIVGNAGIEYFPSQSYSIRAEFSEGVQYRWGPSTSTSNYPYSTPSLNINSGTNKGWLFGGSSVYFGLGICI